MSLVVNFKHFEPLTGKLPERYDYIFAELADRARRLVAGRGSDEIKAAARILSEIHRAPGYRDPLSEELKQAPIATMLYGEEVEVIPASNEVEALYKNVGNVPLADYPDFPNGQWHELFAVLALSYMDQICGAVHAQESWQPVVKNKWLEKDEFPNPFQKLTDSEIDRMAAN